MAATPEDLPVYRLIVETDIEVFSRRVTESLDMGYELYGSPAITYDGKSTVAAQAVLFHGSRQTSTGVGILARVGRTDDAAAVP